MSYKVIIFIDRVAAKNYLQIEAIEQLYLSPEFFVSENIITQTPHQVTQHILANTFFKRIKQVSSFLKKNKTAVHHIEVYPGGRFSFLYILLAKLYGIKCICVERGDLLYYNKQGYSMVTRFSMWFCYKFSDLIWYKEPYMKKTLQKLNKNLFFLHNAVKIKNKFPNFSPLHKDITFLWMNRAIPQRRSDWFIEVLKSDELKNTSNYFVGIMPSSVYKSEQDHLKKNKPDNLTIENYCRTPEEFYKRSKFFVLAADVIFANHSLLESMSYGVVPLVSQQSGTDLIVENEINGLVFNHTEKEFTSTMLKALTLSDAEYSRLSNAAIEKIKNDFSEEKYISQIKLMYASI